MSPFIVQRSLSLRHTAKAGSLWIWGVGRGILNRGSKWFYKSVNRFLLGSGVIGHAVGQTSNFRFVICGRVAGSDPASRDLSSRYSKVTSPLHGIMTSWFLLLLWLTAELPVTCNRKGLGWNRGRWGFRLYSQANVAGLPCGSRTCLGWGDRLPTVTEEARLEPQARPYGICGVQTGTGTGLSSSEFVTWRCVIVAIYRVLKWHERKFETAWPLSLLILLNSPNAVIH